MTLVYYFILHHTYHFIQDTIISESCFVLGSLSLYYLWNSILDIKLFFSLSSIFYLNLQICIAFEQDYFMYLLFLKHLNTSMVGLINVLRISVPYFIFILFTLYVTDGEDIPSGSAVEKGMATPSSVLAWRIPWTEEPGGLQSMGSLKSWTRLSD